MASIRYKVVSTFVGVKRPFSRTANFTNAKIAIAHARNNGNTSVVVDMKKNLSIFQTVLTSNNR